jgi:hypothetical protein
LLPIPEISRRDRFPVYAKLGLGFAHLYKLLWFLKGMGLKIML